VHLLRVDGAAGPELCERRWSPPGQDCQCGRRMVGGSSDRSGSKILTICVFAKPHVRASGGPDYASQCSRTRSTRVQGSPSGSLQISEKSRYRRCGDSHLLTSRAASSIVGPTIVGGLGATDRLGPFTGVRSGGETLSANLTMFSTESPEKSESYIGRGLFQLGRGYAGGALRSLVSRQVLPASEKERTEINERT
jgi:hypothetical protein